MMTPLSSRYNGFVLGGWRRGVVATLLASLCFLTLSAAARADEQIDVGPSPVLNVHLTRGKLIVQTWDRPQVEITSSGPVDVRHVAPQNVDPGMPKALQVASQQVGTGHGPIVLPAESFVLPQLAGSAHDAVMARADSGDVTITIPSGTAMVIAHLRGGHFTLRNYQGVFVARARTAGILLDHVGGTGFVESLRGRILATNSTFDRLRARTATGNILFQGCTSHQIQASSSYGSIVYDNGHFQPGLARFESDHGNVALGVRGGAQIGAHSGTGHVVSSFRNNAQVRGDPTTEQAKVGGGGPVVTATSKNGSVYLYSGSMNDHPRVRQQLSGSARLPVRQQTMPPPAQLPPPPPAQPRPGRPPLP